MMEFKFQRHRIDKFSREKILEELEKSSKIYNYTEFGWRDFNKVANISASPVKKEFGSWRKALESLREHLKRKNIDLSPRKVSPNRIYSDKELFDEMEKIWKELGHRPSRTEWNFSEPKISYQYYKQRFDGWKNACFKFIEYKMGKVIILDDKQDQNEYSKNITSGFKPEDRRDISYKLRYEVFNRDNFKCVFCGRSPAIQGDVILHIDHKIPFSKGEKTEISNLQTLCCECNIGKGNR